LDFDSFCDLGEKGVIYDDPIEYDDIEMLHPKVIITSIPLIIKPQGGV
jgi:hypothetical protein